MLRLLRIQPGEGTRVGLMLVYSVAAVGGVVITGQLVGRSLFLGNLETADIPYKFILPPLAMVAVAAVYGRVADRLRRDRLIVGTCALLAAGVVALQVLLASDLGDSFAALCGLYVFTDVAGALVVLQFWTFAGDIFDPREARRLFGLITGGSTLSNLVFGLGLSSAATSVAPERLLLVVAVSLLVCAACAALLGRHCAATLEAVRRPADASAARARRRAPRNPLVFTLAGLVLTVAVVSYIADYMLDLALRDSFGDDSGAMLGFLGRFRFFAGVGACLLQFLVAGRLLDRFGIVAALALLPIAIAGGSLAVLATGGALLAAAIPRAGDVMLKYTVHDAALNLLYLPIGDRLRARTKAFLDGVLKPPVAAVVGLVFLAVGPTTAPQDWALPLLLIVGGWLLLVRHARGQYVDALARSLQLRRLDLEAVAIDLSDPGSVRVVRDALASDDAMRVAHALGWLENMETVDWTDDVTPLTTHISPEVRAGAVAFLGRRAGARAGVAIGVALTDHDARVRRAAVEALGQVADEARLRTYIEDPDPEVRRTAVRWLLRLGVGDGVDLLRHLAGDAEPTTRAAAAALLVEVSPVPDDILSTLLADPAEDVAAAALRAAACAEPLPSLARLEPFFSQPGLRPAALAAARAWASSDPLALVTAVDAPTTSLAARLAMVEALGAAAPGAVADDLTRWLAAPDARLRSATLGTVLRLRNRQARSPVPRASLESRLEVEAAEALSWLVARHAAAGAEDALLDDALGHRWRSARSRVLMLLDLLCEEVVHARVEESLASGDRRRVGAAIELVDQVLPRRLAAVPAVLDAASPPPADAVAEPSLANRLRGYADGDDPWLAACAVRAARRLWPESDPGASPMPLSVLEKVFFLKSVSLFQPLPGEEIAELVPIVDEVEFAAGEVFIRRGDEGSCLYILVEGEVITELDEGRERLLSSPEVIGELAVLAQRPRSADCRARTDVVALRIDKDAFWQLLDERPRIAIEVMKALVTRYVPPEGG